MLQEKDKKIEELTKMLKQKQRLVETLRSQLEQGKMAGGLLVEKDGSEKSKTNTPIKASAIQPPTLPNGLLVKVKKEVEVEEEMEGVTEEAQAKKQILPMQCSQETLFRQHIHWLQQAEQQKRQLQQPKLSQKVTEVKSTPQKQQQQKKEAQILLQEQRIQQLIIQQTQQKQLQAESKLAQQKPVQQNHLKQTQGQVQQSQQKNQAQLKQVQVQIQNQIVVSQKPAGNPVQQRKQLKPHQRHLHKQQTPAVTTQQVTLRYNCCTSACCESYMKLTGEK